MRFWWPIPGFALAAFVFAWVDGDSGLRTWWQLRQDHAAASARIATLRADVATHQETSASLEADDFAIERAIRERLEYAKPGETVVRMDDPKPLSYQFH